MGQALNSTVRADESLPDDSPQPEALKNELLLWNVKRENRIKGTTPFAENDFCGIRIGIGIGIEKTDPDPDADSEL